MYLDAAVMDMDEALRTLEIVGSKIAQLDVLMKIKGQQQGEIEGESPRKYYDGKGRHNIIGYYLSAGVPTDSGSGQAAARRRYSAMRIVRCSDASTSSIMSAFAKNEAMTVELSTFRAGGDSSPQTQPLFLIKLENARVKSFTLMVGSALPNVGAVEIFEITFREMSIESAPQTATGTRGGVRTFNETLATES